MSSFVEVAICGSDQRISLSLYVRDSASFKTFKIPALTFSDLHFAAFSDMSLNDDHVRPLKYGTLLENPMLTDTKWIATEKLKKNLILKLEERIQRNTLTGSVKKSIIKGHFRLVFSQCHF